jgi:GTP-binding protein
VSLISFLLKADLSCSSVTSGALPEQHHKTTGPLLYIYATRTFVCRKARKVVRNVKILLQTRSAYRSFHSVLPQIETEEFESQELRWRHPERSRFSGGARSEGSPLRYSPRRSSLANLFIFIANLSMRVLSRFLAAATNVSHFPAPTLPEIAFLGRSNVGKSSVINSLVGAKLARTSSTPGRTRSINFFEIRWPGKPQPEMIFTDLPGYGYAKISREISQEWPKFIEPYLNDRPSLALCVALVDVSIPPQQSDRQLLDFLSALGRDFILVATKSDRLSHPQLQNSLRTLAQEYSAARLLPYSSKTGAGRDELWKHIRHASTQATIAAAPSQ